MFRFFETDIREQKKYEKRIQTSVNFTVNDLCYGIKFEICVKDKSNFSIERNIAERNIAFLFPTKIYFILGEIPKSLIAQAFFYLFVFVLLRQTLKNIDMPR